METILAASIPALISAIVAVITIVASHKDTKKQLAAQKDETDEQQNELIVETLRNSLMTIYSTYRVEKQMPILVYEGMCKSYDNYEKKGGNSFIKVLKSEMDSWYKY